METSLYIFIGISFITIFGLFYMLYRNQKVYRLRIRIIDLCSDYNKRHIHNMEDYEQLNSYRWLYNKLPTYDEMFMSFTKIKLENYITKEDYQKLIN